MKAQRTDELIELAIKRRISETNGHNNKKKTSLWQKQWNRKKIYARNGRGARSGLNVAPGFLGISFHRHGLLGEKSVAKSSLNRFLTSVRNNRNSKEMPCPINKRDALIISGVWCASICPIVTMSEPLEIISAAPVPSERAWRYLPELSSSRGENVAERVLNICKSNSTRQMRMRVCTLMRRPQNM
jgi:hypothetical protein